MWGIEGGIPQEIGEEIPIPLPNPQANSVKGSNEDVILTETISSPLSSFNQISTKRSDPDFTRHSENSICTILEYMARQGLVAYNRNYPMVLGTSIEEEQDEVEVIADDDAVESLIGTPWLAEYMKKRYNITIDPPKKQRTVGKTITVDAGIISEHALILGAIGNGKTIMALKILHDQLKAGASCVIIDVKKRTIQEALAMAEKAGLTKDQITMIYPTIPDVGVPCWNPLHAPSVHAIHQTASQFMRLVLGSEQGAIVGPALRNGAAIIAAANLTIQELIWFFQDVRYRQGLINSLKATEVYPHVIDAIKYFEVDFKAATNNQPYDPVLNKITKYIQSEPYLSALFTGVKDTLDLPSLWKKQRLLLVHLGFEQNENIAFAQLLTSTLLGIARKDDPWVCPVVLMLDEVRIQQEMVKQIIPETQAIGRSLGLWILASTQELDALDGELARSLMGKLTALKIFLKLDSSEAAIVMRNASWAEEVMPVSRVVIDVYKRDKDKVPEVMSLDAPILYKGESTMALTGDLLDAVNEIEGAYDRREYLRDAFSTANIRMTDLTVLQNNQQYDLEKYLYITGGEWELVNREKVSVRVWFIKPKKLDDTRVTESEQRKKVERRLMGTQKRQSVVITKEGGNLGLIDNVDFSLPDLPEVRPYLQGRYQDATVITETKMQREQMKEQLINSLPPPEPKSGRQATVPVKQPEAQPTRRLRPQPSKIEPVFTKVDPEVLDDGSV